MEAASEDLVAKQLPEFHNILNNLKTYLNESISGITRLHEHVSDGTNRDKGLSFLEMKSQLFIQYLINVTYSMLLKLDGKQLEGEECIENLVEIRTVLSKIRPMEKKLKYQIDKFVKMATPGTKTTEQHALSFKPNVANLVDKDEENSDEGDGETTAEDKSGVYVPPKLTAVPYAGDKLSREEKKLEKARQRSLNTNLLDDMRQEFGDEPEEISDGRNRSMHRKLKQVVDEREQFEETNLKRLTITKKDKAMKHKLNQLDEVVKIGNFTSLSGGGNESDGDENFMPKFKKKKGGKGKDKGKFKKRMQRKT